MFEEEEEEEEMDFFSCAGEEEEEEDVILDDEGLMNMKMKYKNMKVFKRNKKDKKKLNLLDADVSSMSSVYNKNIMLSHALYKQNVLAFIEKCPSLKSLDPLKMEILVSNTANMLHHCNLLWSGNLDFYYGEVDIQLPKDCNLRVYTSIYHVVTQVYPLMSSISFQDMLKDFYTLDRSMEKSRKRGGLKKTKEKLFFDNIHRFVIIIHRYDLGGRKYKRLVSKYSPEVSCTLRCDLDYTTDSPTTRMYSNMLRHFFDIWKEYTPYKEQCLDLIERALFSVVLQGKGVRMVHMVCIYYVIIVRNLPTEERKRPRRGIDNSLSSMKINNLIENKDDVSGILYERLMSHYMVMLEEDIKTTGRRRKNFIKCLQKYITRS